MSLCLAIISLAFAILSGCAGPAVQRDFTPVSLPTVQAGDRWQYRINDAYNGNPVGTLRVQIEETGPEHIVARETERDGDGDAGVRRTFTREWNPESGRMPAGLPLAPFTHGIESGTALKYAPAYPALRFPLARGKRWNERILATDPATQKRVAIRVRARVVGSERIKVPAGEFDAIKVRREVFYEDGEWWRSPTEALETDWYAPEINAVVQRYTESQFWDYSSGSNNGGADLRLGDRRVIELESYSRASPGRP